MTQSDSRGVSAPNGCGRRAAALIWQTTVQQSIFERSAGFDGMCPFITHPDIAPGAAKASLVAIGPSASPSAHSKAMKSLITREG